MQAAIGGWDSVDREWCRHGKNDPLFLEIDELNFLKPNWRPEQNRTSTVEVIAGRWQLAQPCPRNLHAILPVVQTGRPNRPQPVAIGPASESGDLRTNRIQQRCLRTHTCSQVDDLGRGRGFHDHGTSLTKLHLTHRFDLPGLGHDRASQRIDDRNLTVAGNRHDDSVVAKASRRGAMNGTRRSDRPEAPINNLDLTLGDLDQRPVRTYRQPAINGN